MVGDYPPDMETTTDNGSASVIQIDNGKHIAAVAICAALAATAAVIAVWCAWQFTTVAARYEKVAVDTGTEYRVQLNHYMEIEAKQKVMADEIEELKHGQR